MTVLLTVFVLSVINLNEIVHSLFLKSQNKLISSKLRVGTVEGAKFIEEKLLWQPEGYKVLKLALVQTY
jgi:hypothetical protein